jgi:hypothetical protein
LANASSNARSTDFPSPEFVFSSGRNRAVDRPETADARAPAKQPILCAASNVPPSAERFWHVLTGHYRESRPFENYFHPKLQQPTGKRPAQPQPVLPLLVIGRTLRQTIACICLAADASLAVCSVLLGRAAIYSLWRRCLLSLPVVIPEQILNSPTAPLNPLSFPRQKLK